MSCKHLIWNCYCKYKQDFCERNLFPRLCEDYCTEDEVEDMKKIFNKGPVTNTNCACNESTADNDYVSILEIFINKLYPSENFRFFGLTAIQAEAHVERNMMLLGYNENIVTRAFNDTCNSFHSQRQLIYVRLTSFIDNMLMRKHKDYENYPFGYRFVLTLVLGYLGKLDSVAIINCDNPENYFKDKVDEVRVPDLEKAVNQTRQYIKESNNTSLAEGMRKFEAWLERLAKENIPPKELTVADIEKQLGYKIKIVGEN